MYQTFRRSQQLSLHVVLSDGDILFCFAIRLLNFLPPPLSIHQGMLSLRANQLEKYRCAIINIAYHNAMICYLLQAMESADLLELVYERCEGLSGGRYLKRSTEQADIHDEICSHDTTCRTC